MSEQRVLPPDVYDALELSALVYDGIGAGAYRDEQGNPCCVIGHAIDLTTSHEPSLAHELRKHGISLNQNDHAVVTINWRRRKPVRSRVSFKDWCRELNVVRGVAGEEGE